METAYQYRKADAFTSGNSLGNPAACLYLGEGQALGDREMLEIARQHKGFVSEVVYCARSDEGITLTYYSSECEVDFCGHGTIACMYSLIREDPALLRQGEIRIQTRRKGPLTVYNRIPDQDAVFITAPEPAFLGTKLSRGDVAASLGLPEAAIDPALPVDRIDAGLRTLIVPLKDLKTEVSTFPDEKRLKAFCEGNGIDIVLIYAREVENPESFAHTRVFAPRFGYLEDPATGSGNAAFGHYLLRYGMWDGKGKRVEQGGMDRAYNQIRLATRGGAVLFGGRATVRIEGIYYLKTPEGGA